MSELTPEQEALKREIYNQIPQRRRKWIDRIGYDNWDPFQKPNDPIEIRTDPTRRTTQQLVREFLWDVKPERYSTAYGRGALEFALGMVNRDDRYLAMMEFSLWYVDLLKREGKYERFLKELRH